MGLLEGKVAIVTGSGRGIGRAVAIALAAEGAAIGLAARSRDEIESAAAEIRGRGGSAVAVPTEVGRQEDVDALVATVRDRLGDIDILVNNAAVTGPTGLLWETDMGAWQEVFEINVLGLVRCARAVLPGMVKRRRGKIINVGSEAGRSDAWAATHAEQPAYGATKAAVIRFSECLAHQVKTYGINVNCVGVRAHTRLSGESRMALNRVRGESVPAMPDEVPPQERMLPQENVGAFIFLAFTLSDHVTGAYLEANSLPDYIHRHW